MTLLTSVFDLDPPICDVCNRPVDSIENRHDIVTLEIVWIARCHGQSEEVRLGQEYVKLNGIRGLSFGKAFIRKALATNAKAIEPLPSNPMLGEFKRPWFLLDK